MSERDREKQRLRERPREKGTEVETKIMSCQHMSMVERPPVVHSPVEEKRINCSIIQVKSKRDQINSIQENDPKHLPENPNQNDGTVVQMEGSPPNDTSIDSIPKSSTEKLSIMITKKRTNWIFLLHLFLSVFLVLGVHYGPSLGFQPITACWIILGFGIIITGAFCLYIRNSK